MVSAADDGGTYIPQVEIPPELNVYVEWLEAHVLDAVKRGDIDKERGTIGAPCPPELRVAATFWLWLAEVNDIIASLNLVLTDLDVLSTDIARFSGCPRQRYLLLVRTYFHEFHRFRETFGHALKALQHHGLVDRAMRKSAVEGFNVQWEGMIWLRNVVAHDSPTWPGIDHFHLTAAAMAHSVGIDPVAESPGQLPGLQEALAVVCQNRRDFFLEAGRRMATVHRTLIHELVAIPRALQREE
jgi:hypothetical protein